MVFRPLPIAAVLVVAACKPSSPSTAPEEGPPPAETGTEATLPTIPTGDLRITEIHYHPVLEEDYDDRHEFLEVSNAGSTPVSLAGWQVDGIGYVLPSDTVVAPGDHLVIAKDPVALLGIASYGLSAEQVVGPYDGQLANGGEALALIRPDGTVADAVAYSDDFPWPIAADALGAGAAWLAPELLPLEDHRYRGVSLERVSLDADPSDPETWVPSALDAASPGAPYAGLRESPLPILLSRAATAAGGGPIGDGDPVVLALGFSGSGVLSDGVVEWFVDDLERTDEPLEQAPIDTVDLEDRQAGVALPAQPADTIVRYRVLADRGDGLEVVSPRPSDPYPFHAYFVDPEPTATARTYRLFVAPADWTQLWTNLDDGREVGCEASETWNDKVPAVFVHDGRVHDVRVRYQGSRYNRANGASVGDWPHPAPSEPSPLQGLSWRVGFPRYDRFEGRKALGLNKLTQGCPGLTAGVGFELFRQAGLPASTTRYVRLYINGGYYRYMQEIERPGEAMLEAWHEAEAAALGVESEPVGHLYKSVGLAGDAGPFGWGDGRPLTEDCGHTAYDRYVATYERKTHTWETHDPLIEMIEDLDAFRAPDGTLDVPGTRAYLEAHFDVDAMLNHLAVMNYSVPFDDYFQNHFLYQRRSDGRWMLLPWDLDRNFGAWAESGGGGAQASIFGGRNGDLVGGIDANRSGWWNRIKDSFLAAYEDEFIERITELNETVLHPDNIAAEIARVQASYDPDVAAAASSPSCDMEAEAAAFQAFVDERHDFIATTPPEDLVHW